MSVKSAHDPNWHWNEGKGKLERSRPSDGVLRGFRLWHNANYDHGIYCGGELISQADIAGVEAFLRSELNSREPIMSAREIQKLRNQWEAATTPEFNEPWSLRTHNGCVTITNPQTKNWRTFRVHTQPGTAKFAPGKRILSLLVGPDNVSDYQSFAFVDGGKVKVWKSKRSRDNLRFVAMLEDPEGFMRRRGLKYSFEGKCRKCNRRLTTAESIERGVGPKCWADSWGDF